MAQRVAPDAALLMLATALQSRVAAASEPASKKQRVGTAAEARPALAWPLATGRGADAKWRALCATAPPTGPVRVFVQHDSGARAVVAAVSHGDGVLRAACAGGAVEARCPSELVSAVLALSRPPAPVVVSDVFATGWAPPGTPAPPLRPLERLLTEADPVASRAWLRIAGALGTGTEVRVVTAGQQLLVTARVQRQPPVPPYLVHTNGEEVTVFKHLGALTVHAASAAAEPALLAAPLQWETKAVGATLWVNMGAVGMAPPS
jgi:hypothetical protein